MAINPLLLNVKPISEITTVDNPTNGHLLFYDGIDELKKVDIIEFQSLIGGIAKPLAIADATPTTAGWYKPTTSGTYANAGGLVAQKGYDTLFYFDGTTWSLIEVDLPQPIVNNITNNNSYTIDPEQIVPSEALYADDTLAGDVLKRVDKNAGIDVNYREVTAWYDGTPMNDSKLDNVIFIKKDDKYYQKQIDKKEILKVNTIADLRNFNGYYQGQEVVLIGYYNAGDKEPRIYKFSSGTGLDDGGQTINTSKGKWELLHTGELNVEDYGVFDQRAENYVQFQKLLNNDTVKKINFNSVYKFTGSFVCNNVILFTSKKKDNKIIFSHTTSVATFTGTGNIALENINIDYDNKHCLRFFLYDKNLGKVSVKNVTFSNVNDDVS